MLGNIELLADKAKIQLATYVQPGERILQCMISRHESGRDALVALGARLIVISQVEKDTRSIEYLDIKEIEVEKGSFGGVDFMINYSRVLTDFRRRRHDPGAEFRKFAEWLRLTVREARSSPTVRKNEDASEIDAITDLERLAVLRRNGYLSDEEFSQAKRTLLGL